MIQEIKKLKIILPSFNEGEVVIILYNLFIHDIQQEVVVDKGSCFFVEASSCLHRC